MRQLRVVIYEVDDEQPDSLMELAALDVPSTNVVTDHPETTLDHVEADIEQHGHTILRHLFQAQWNHVDTKLVEAYRQRFSP